MHIHLIRHHRVDLGLSCASFMACDRVFLWAKRGLYAGSVRVRRSKSECNTSPARLALAAE